MSPSVHVRVSTDSAWSLGSGTDAIQRFPHGPLISAFILNSLKEISRYRKTCPGPTPANTGPPPEEGAVHGGLGSWPATPGASEHFLQHQ